MATLFTLLVLAVLLASPFYVIYKPPALIIAYFQWKWPDVLWHVDTTRKVVALTVDDAPSRHTAEILQLLKENDAHATFFVIGSQVPGREDTLRQIVQSGNELANHAMHDEPSLSLTDAQLEHEIRAVSDLIRRVYAAEDLPTPPNYFRPGSGFFSDRMRALVDKLGYRLVLGGIYPHDPQVSWWRANANHILSMLRPGAIIICHDRRSWTIPMLRRVLPELKRRGYEIVTVTDLVREGHS